MGAILLWVATWMYPFFFFIFFHLYSYFMLCLIFSKKDMSAIFYVRLEGERLIWGKKDWKKINWHFNLLINLVKTCQFKLRDCSSTLDNVCASANESHKKCDFVMVQASAWCEVPVVFFSCILWILKPFCEVIMLCQRMKHGLIDSCAIVIGWL